MTSVLPLSSQKSQWRLKEEWGFIHGPRGDPSSISVSLFHDMSFYAGESPDCLHAYIHSFSEKNCLIALTVFQVGMALDTEGNYGEKQAGFLPALSQFTA